ncbi:MAG: helix-turn-helix transcriptional regulator [Bacillota bacterium]|uniref:helix-turn-helix transcriptional regulator n=1 Tax=unclassified Virgibacillus TaxID=2620237 RepID=UPI000EF4419C|nr:MULTISPECIES: metalloregulator ArsR/SmtB family transcription factor [unclassified Virgibacillus]MCC2248531.1 transcriptional regulator [Virgibacillus sp. AGTR]MDY7043034.1 metalloregulator ArsR/SmtB family transcription factor [Virgibacillus sp. M23]QRZ16608.1 transcriptional regulator [Virgibacillus sp. AGTR]
MERITTKDKILHLLKKEVKLTVGELKRHLNITDMAVRKHLSIMEKDGLIFSEEVKQSMGRPMQQYSLSEKGELLFPKSYEGLSVEFLNDIRDLHGDDSIQRLFQRRENRLTNEYNIRMYQKSPSERIKEMEMIQNEKGYMADITKIDANTYELTEYNCPIMAVAKEYKIACRCETSMFQKVLQTDNVTRTSCKTEGNDHCRFLIAF